jgi:hypothetical protein
MPQEITNTLRSKSTIRVTGNTNTLVTLAQLSSNTQLETVSAASIAHISTSGDSTWRVYRGNDAAGTLVLELNKNHTINLEDMGIGAIANSATSNVFITNDGTGGTLIMVMSKSATYSRDL